MPLPATGGFRLSVMLTKGPDRLKERRRAGTRTAADMDDDLTIRVDATPNPNSLKFTVNRTLWEGRAQTFSDPSQTFASPLAAELLTVHGVRSVFFLRDFVTISRDQAIPWDSIAPEIERILRDYLDRRG
jgi:hypothetical protein